MSEELERHLESVKAAMKILKPAFRGITEYGLNVHYREHDLNINQAMHDVLRIEKRLQYLMDSIELHMNHNISI